MIGIRFAFEMPVDLRANWIFRISLEHRWTEARRVSRRVLLVFSLSWLAPACFLLTLLFWGWVAALLHTAVFILCTIALVELSLFKFRKIPFTCAYPPFKSHSGRHRARSTFLVFSFSRHTLRSWNIGRCSVPGEPSGLFHYFWW